MPQYIISYLGGDHPSTPEEGKQHFAKYQQWIAGLGDAAVKPMVPLKSAHTVSPDGSITEGSSIGLSGQTVIQADSIETALAMVKTCPFLDINGTLEVAEVVEM